MPPDCHLIISKKQDCGFLLELWALLHYGNWAAIAGEKLSNVELTRECVCFRNGGIPDRFAGFLLLLHTQLDRDYCEESLLGFYCCQHLWKAGEEERRKGRNG